MWRKKKIQPVEAGTRNQSAREAWLERTLKKIPPGSRILDAGAGELQYKRFCAHLVYVSQDFGRYDGKGDRRGLQTEKREGSNVDIVCDITDIPEADGSFDAVMCVEVLEHLPDPLPALREFRRLLGKGGRLVLTAPFCSLTHYAPYHFVTGFNRYYYEHHLAALGFRILDIAENGNFFEYLAQEVRRVPLCAEKYSSHRLSGKDNAVIRDLLQALGRLSETDGGSGELLCYGYHVFAEKE